ncbi:MAG TPA: hypothetical protein VGH99_12185 [Pseudonocardia sp.]|jgi:hypothetical protein
MPGPVIDMDTARVSRALAGQRFPARTWELIAQADYNGTDLTTRAELLRLPTAVYPDLAAVLGAVEADRTPLHKLA